MDLKTIALDSVPAVAELKEFKRGYNDGMRGESAATESGEGYWAGYDKGRWDDGLFGCLADRNEASEQSGSCRDRNGR